MNQKKIKVLVFIGSLQCGGKERRLVELMTFLKSNPRIDFFVVVTRDKVQYMSFFELGIPYYVIPKSWKNNDLSIFRKFYSICQEYKPDIIHSWGRIQTLYALPAARMLGIPLCNSQITTGLKPKTPLHLGFIDRLNYRYSDIILTNSVAGRESFAPPRERTKVIYNGINLKRFQNLPPVEEVKEKYGIRTKHAVIMSASFNGTKDYRLFCRIAGLVTKRNPEVTFIGVGDYNKSGVYYQEIKKYSEINPRALFPGKVQDIEALVNACTIGVLFSAMEGISNAILEYMALGKPVVASDSGGNGELVTNGLNGYLIRTETDEQIADKILSLIENPGKCEVFGDVSRNIIHSTFRNDIMGNEFMKVYQQLLGLRSSGIIVNQFERQIPTSLADNHSNTYNYGKN
ncbi:MAG: glycosyltransferase [Chitinophagaceae bacterium]